MKTKHTREYARKLALESKSTSDGATQLAYLDGYMKAIEETNVAELLEALIKSMKFIDNMKIISSFVSSGAQYDHVEIYKWSRELLENNQQAIKKATI